MSKYSWVKSKTLAKNLVKVVEVEIYCTIKYENQIHSTQEWTKFTASTEICCMPPSVYCIRRHADVLQSSVHWTKPFTKSWLSKLVLLLRLKIKLHWILRKELALDVQTKWVFKNWLAKLWWVLNIGEHRLKHVYRTLPFIQKSFQYHTTLKYFFNLKFVKDTQVGDKL